MNQHRSLLYSTSVLRQLGAVGVRRLVWAWPLDDAASVAIVKAQAVTELHDSADATGEIVLSPVRFRLVTRVRFDDRTAPVTALRGEVDVAVPCAPPRPAVAYGESVRALSIPELP